MNENIYIKKKITTFSSFLAYYRLHLGLTADKKIIKNKKKHLGTSLLRARDSPRRN